MFGHRCHKFRGCWAKNQAETRQIRWVMYFRDIYRLKLRHKYVSVLLIVCNIVSQFGKLSPLYIVLPVRCLIVVHLVKKCFIYNKGHSMSKNVLRKCFFLSLTPCVSVPYRIFKLSPKCKTVCYEIGLYIYPICLLEVPSFICSTDWLPFILSRSGSRTFITTNLNWPLAWMTG